MYRRRYGLHVVAALAALLWIGAATAQKLPPRPSQVLRVGPGQQFVMPSVAAQFARDGDTVEIEAGDYPGDAAVWKAHDLTVRGVGGLARLPAQGAAAEGKAIWVVKGDNMVIENVEFSGARVPDRNGAGIRLEGTGLTVRHSVFRGNENGILCGSNKNSDILVEYSEFDRNGHGDGQSHNIYCGMQKSLTLRYNYIHHANAGHNVKSRAEKTFVLYNRIGDEAGGNASYSVELPNGGIAVVMGNLIHKGPQAENNTMISFGAEGYKHGRNALYVASNTLVSDRPGGTRFVFAREGADEVRVTNNLIVGKGSLLEGPGEARRNLPMDAADFRNAGSWDFRPKTGSRAIGAAIDAGEVDGMSLKPAMQYVHKAKGAPRRDQPRDLGAFGAR